MVLKGKLLAEAALTLAPDGLSEFEHLLNSFIKLSTLVAFEGTDLELGLDLSRPRDCALY